MNLERYIEEAVSGKRRTKGHTPIESLPNKPSKNDLIKWLIANKYEDVDDFSSRSSYAIGSYRKMFCTIGDFLRKGTSVICITNGDGYCEYRLFFDTKQELTSMAIVKILSGRPEIFNLLCDTEGIQTFKNWLVEDINEAIYHGSNRKYSDYKELEDSLDFNEIQKWLLYKGYPDLAVEHSTQYLLSRKMVGFYIPKYTDDKFRMLCVVNGDGITEYRLLFGKNNGKLERMFACRISGKHWNLERLSYKNGVDDIDDNVIRDLKEWLNKGSGIREAVSHGYHRNRTNTIQIEWNYDREDVATVLEDSGYKKVDFISYSSGVNEFRKWFSGKNKEFIVYIGLSTDYIAVSNENRDYFYLISFKKLYGDKTKMSDISEVRFNKGSGGEGAVTISVSTDELIEYLEH